MAEWSEEIQIAKARNELVVKDNKLLQTVTRRKYELGTQEQKALGYLLSLIQLGDENKKPPYIYTFDTKIFCDICGINRDSGSNLQSIKKSLDSLAENSFWLDYGGGEFRFQWIVTPDIHRGEGVINVEIPSMVFPYLVGLTENFTEYELWQILPMKSAYSIALFELLKSYAYKHVVVVSLEQLRAYLAVGDKYHDFRNFQRKVLDMAKREINDLTDLTIDWRGIRNGRSYNAIEFIIATKKDLDVVEAYRRSKAILNGIKHTEGQINIFE